MDKIDAFFMGFLAALIVISGQYVWQEHTARHIRANSPPINTLVREI